MKNNFGLAEKDIETIIKILQQYPDIESACIFGSRAKGNYQNGSDVDIVLKGKNLSFNIISAINYILNEETMMPYNFDILNYNTIKNVNLIEHIDRIGIKFYKNN